MENSEAPRDFKIGIVVVSDSAEINDKVVEIESIINNILSPFGGNIEEIQVAPDDFDRITTIFKEMSDIKEYNLVITVGGTGLSLKNNVPEATLHIIDREIPGFSEIMRSETFKITKRAILSRGVTGIRGKTMILNLPGSPSGISQCLEVVSDAIPLAIELIEGNVNNCSDN